MSIRIVAAEPSHIPWLLTQCQAFSDHYGSVIPLYPGEDYGTALLEKLIVDHVVFIALQSEAQPVGFIAGMLIDHPMNPTIRVLSELLWWVTPAYRGSRAALLLLDAYTHYGAVHADWTTCSLEASTNVNDRSLTKRGYRLNERSYFMETP